MRKIINFLKPTVTGPDGKASHRKINVLYFMILLTYMIIKTTIGAVYPEIAWIVVSGGAGLFSGLSIWQQKVNKIKDENEYSEESITYRNFNNPNS
jgi:hypothetical protein